MEALAGIPISTSNRNCKVSSKDTVDLFSQILEILAILVWAGHCMVRGSVGHLDVWQMLKMMDHKFLENC